MKRQKFLIIEDDAEQLKRYCDLIAELKYEVHYAKSVNEAIEVLTTENIEIPLTDIHLTDAPHQKTFEGYRILEYLRDNCPEVLPLIMSFDPRIETFNKALSLGAVSFIKKPVINSQEIEIAILTGKEKLHYRKLEKNLQKSCGFDALNGCSDGIILSAELRKKAINIARSKVTTCVLMGETGTGKEEYAKFIHRRRVENEGPIPFVAVNCANIETSLAVSQLFGHRKGAFTGADQASNGYIGEANGGILFLDEIHHLSAECQRKLLRVIHDGSYQRLGDTKTLYSTFQLIVATTSDLDDLVNQGKFLLDLRARMIGIDITLPPLRERLNDIQLLVPMFFAKACAQVEPEEMTKIINLCQKFYWPGNIRQLYRVILTFVSNSQLEEIPIQAKDFPVSKNLYAPPTAGLKEAVTPPTIQELLAEPSEVSDAIRLLKKGCHEDVTFKEVVDTAEKAILKATLKRYSRVVDALQALDLSRSTYDSKRKYHQMD